MCNIAHLSCCTIVEMRSKHFCNETPSPSLSYINNIQSLRNMMWLLYNSTYVNRPYTILELKTVGNMQHYSFTYVITSHIYLLISHPGIHTASSLK